ncbi:uncharacterized protein LOC124361119 [Homalodisca vitripennis]|uniref:uncharacterized protein LOC124361119 n=1 Tax=Homalodisca vitripennis TaxID=197043 RepID=UPI001EEC5C5D|nr:uncharacterized protein LOC124361119 [Homalodisca vitripennis]
MRYPTLLLFTCVIVLPMFGPSEALYNCDAHHLLQCLRPIGNSWADEFQLICSGLDATQRCIDEFARKCLHPLVRARFNHLYSISNHVIQKVCETGVIRGELLSHARCLKSVKHSIDNCGKDFASTLDIIGLTGPAGTNVGD